MQSKIISLALVGLSFVACTNQTKTVVNTNDALKSSIDSLKKAVKFDKRENIFDYKIDTNSAKELVFSVKTTDANFTAQAVELAKKQGFSKSEVITLPVDSQLVATPYAVVTQSVANMRVGKSRAKGMATQTLMGMQMELLEKDGQWHKVKNAQGYIAWIPKPSFQYLTKAEADSLKALPKVMVTANTTFAYNVENNKQVVTDLVYGNVLTLEKKGKKYTTVTIPGGRKAVVKTSELTPLKEWQANAKFNKQHVIDYGYNFNGQPYLWGGNSFKGIDCSGFSGAVYYSMGVFLPRDASQQIKQGDEIEYSVEKVNVNGKEHSKLVADKLEVGDLLFFGNKKRGSVTHVAVWIGNNEYLHSSGKVHVTSVDPTKDNYKEYLVDILVGVRRINGSKNLDKSIDLTKSSIWY
ncbi:MAG: C40 family peptidase [Ichthyobacteriaceae bacterium]|nr:C40 family peptidase [Ichthyobacteriaceae bacterium]